MRGSHDDGCRFPDDAHDAYLMQMLHRAREYDVRRSPLRAALEHHLNRRGLMAEDIVRAEQQRQAASQASVANAITSLRLCTTIDWREYVESVSLVENALRRDPSGIYSRMDFLSRDRQRQRRRGARGADRRIADQGRAQGGRDRATGRGAIAQPRCRARRLPPDRPRPRRPRARSRLSAEVEVARAPAASRAHATAVYLGVDRRRRRRLLVAAALAYAWLSAHPTLMLALVALLFLIPASELAIAFVQKLASRLVHPEPLPRLELARGRARGIQDHRRHSDAVHQRRGRRVAARTSRSRRHRQSRSAHSLRGPLRLRRCRNARRRR